MSDSSLFAALDRIAHAIDRIDAASAAPAVSRPDPALAALEERHATLRAHVQETIEKLDVMIGAAG